MTIFNAGIRGEGKFRVHSLALLLHSSIVTCWLSCWLAKGEVNTYSSDELVCVDFANFQLSSTYCSHTNSDQVRTSMVKQRTL